MIINDKDITENDFINIIKPFENNFKKYMINYVLPDVISFYIADSFYKNCLCDSPLYNHINSSLDMFNGYKNDIKVLIPNVKKILRIKYNLRIISDNQLRLVKVFDVLASNGDILPTDKIKEKI